MKLTLQLGRFKVMTVDAGKDAAHFDVFVEGEDESVASLRIDDDEGTVTFYDPGAIEPHTVYEADDPNLASNLASLLSDWEGLCASRTGEQDEWGWDLFQTSMGYWEIERDDELAHLASDADAVLRVQQLAAEGSAACRLALGIHYHPDNAAFSEGGKS